MAQLLYVLISVIQISLDKENDWFYFISFSIPTSFIDHIYIFKIVSYYENYVEATTTRTQQ